MNPTPPLVPHHGAHVAVAAFLASLVSLGILGSVTGLFQSRGMPMGEVAAAERACSHEAYVSDREDCMRKVIAATQTHRVAKR